MKNFSMVVDTSSGFVTIECQARNKKAAWDYFKKYCRTDKFRKTYGNLWDMKKETLQEVV